MKRLLNISILAFSLVIHAETAPAPTEQEKAMKAMENAGKITEHHKNFEYLVGEWNTKTRLWMSAKDTPQESTGKSTFEPVLEGRFLKENFNGTAMGKPFQGVGFLGYDNVKNKYVSLWMDNMSTSVFKFEGDSPDKGKTINTTSEFICPMTGKNKSIRATHKKINKNKVQYEHFEIDPATGKEFKAMEVIYTRG